MTVGPTRGFPLGVQEPQGLRGILRKELCHKGLHGGTMVLIRSGEALFRLQKTQGVVHKAPCFGIMSVPVTGVTTL